MKSEGRGKEKELRPTRLASIRCSGKRIKSASSIYRKDADELLAAQRSRGSGVTARDENIFSLCLARRTDAKSAKDRPSNASPR